MYDATYNSVYKRIEIEIKNTILDKHKLYIGFNKVFELVYSELVNKISSLTINQNEKKFKEVIEWYNKRYDEYQEEALCLIFEIQMKNCFENINGIKEDFLYINFIKEFASNNVLVEIKRIWYHSTSIYELMYETNDFTDFRISKEYYGHPEHLMQFKRLVYKKHTEENPNDYKSFEEYLEREAKFKMTMNNLNTADLKKPTDLINKDKIEKLVEKSKQVKSFGILERYKSGFLSLYSELSDDFFDEENVCYDVFKTVFTEDWGGEEYIFKFKCNNLEISYFIQEFSFAFENFSKANFGKSKLFKTKGGAKLTANKLSKKGEINIKSENKLKYLKRIALDLSKSDLK